jgi:CO/xanthine dehydrogenase Mo-binding subunit
VLVQWTREEEFRFSPHRPWLDADVSAALDSTGAIAVWSYDSSTNSHAYGGAVSPPGMIEMTAGRNAVPPYRLPQATISLHVVPAAIRTGPFRSLAAAPNVFAIEMSLEADDRVRLERVWCAVDPGHVVHPDGARNQIEGGIQ